MLECPHCHGICTINFNTKICHKCGFNLMTGKIESGFLTDRDKKVLERETQK